MAQSGAIYKRLSRFRSLGDKNTAVWYICNRAIGVSPKWLIRCFRLQDALERLDAGIDMNLAALWPRTWAISIRPISRGTSSGSPG
jgi:hypothetical protein